MPRGRFRVTLPVLGTDSGVLRGVGTGRLRAAVTGAVIATPRRHGKFLVAALRSGPRHRRADPSLVLHFGMTGRLDWVTDGTARHRHDRLVLVTTRGELRYRDQRKLQGIRLAGDDEAVADLLRDIGPDAAAVTAAADRRRLHRTMRDVLRRASPTARVPAHDRWLTGHRDDDEATCPRCGTPLSRAKTGGRSTVFCPRCQRR